MSDFETWQREQEVNRPRENPHMLVCEQCHVVVRGWPDGGLMQGDLVFPSDYPKLKGHTH